MALLQKFRGSKANEDLGWIGFPNESLERQVDRQGGMGFHQRGALAGVAKDEQGRRPQGQSDGCCFRRLIDPVKQLDLLGAQGRFNLSHGLVERPGAGESDHSAGGVVCHFELRWGQVLTPDNHGPVELLSKVYTCPR